MVLRVQWPQQLGTLVCDWKKMTMVFSWENQHHRLVGIGSQRIQITSFNTILKEVKQGNSLFAVCVKSMVEKDSSHLEMLKLLQEFQDIYHEPKDLPPKRGINNHIDLKEGTKLVSIHPYRFGYFLKVEIEKQV